MVKHIRVLQIAFLLVFLGAAFVSKAQSNDSDIAPNVFTPNGDHVNDTFVVKSLTGVWTMNIYDRWGGLVFASEKNANLSWDGHNYLGIEMPEGVYFYIIQSNEGNQSYKGSVHLLR